MRTDEEIVAEFAEWLRDKPRIWPLVERFPPGCLVIADGYLVPSRDRPGTIVSYIEKADGQDTVRVAGEDMVGIPWAGECEPDRLEVVSRGDRAHVFEKALAIVRGEAAN